MPRRHDIETMYPSSGRMALEDNTLLNRADYLQAQRQADTVQASRDGTLFRSWFQGTVAGGTTGWFVLRPPEGVKAFGEARITTIESGEVRSQFLVGGQLGATVGASLPVRNFRQATGPQPQSVFRRYATVTGAEAHSPDRLLTAPTTGPQPRPSDQTDVGAHVEVTHDRFAVFKLTNATGADAAVTLFITWQELPE